MTPGARLAATIELAEAVEQATKPADIVIRNYFRARRYAGAGDRREIIDRVYGLIRRHARLDWWCRQKLGSTSARGRALADLVLNQSHTAKQTEALCGNGQYTPPQLSPSEIVFIRVLENQPLDHPDMSEAVTLEIPAWLADRLVPQWNGDMATQMTALNKPAPVDLRVNTLKADCARALKLLADDGIEAEPTPLSPLGLRLVGRPNLEKTTAFKGGIIEIQDEGSQLAAMLVDAKPGQTVIDLCAGAGGKALAIAALQKDDGRLIACDIDDSRLNRLPQRAKRAGVSTVEICSIQPGIDAELAKIADRVLIDAPCTGTGTWRRQPEARWKLTPDDVDDYTATQATLLKTATTLVKPGGLMIYVTCSILPSENEDRIAAFLATTPNFSPIPIPKVWPGTVGGPCPTDEIFLSLNPADHGTDGFFIAILECRDD